MARDRENVKIPPKTWIEVTDGATTGPFTWVVRAGEMTSFQGTASAVAPTDPEAGIPYERGEGESVPLSMFWGSSAQHLYAYSELGAVIYTNG